MSLRKVRILAEHEGHLRLVCKLFFTDNDFSVYLIPYAKLGRYFFGTSSFKEREIDKTVDFTEQLNSDVVPHLSIHDSGQVSVRDTMQQAGPLSIGPLVDLRGEHVATVTADGFDGLPLFEGEPRTSGGEIDHVIPVETGVGSGRPAMYVNGESPSFAYACRLTFTLDRMGRPKPLYVGVAPIAQSPLGDLARRGVTVISGWVPSVGVQEKSSFIYLRGE